MIIKAMIQIKKNKVYNYYRIIFNILELKYLYANILINVIKFKLFIK